MITLSGPASLMTKRYTLSHERSNYTYYAAPAVAKVE